MTKKELTLHKTKLRTLASFKGFISKFLYDGEFKYAPEKEKLRWLFWLTELNLWLSDRSLGVSIIPYYNGEKLFRPHGVLNFPIYMSYEYGMAKEIEKKLETLPDI